MEIAFTVWAEVETGSDCGGALGAGIGKRLTQEQVDDEADESPCREEDEDHDGPEKRVHAAALGVAIDVSDKEDEAGEEDGHRGDNSGKSERGEVGVVVQLRRENLAAARIVHVDHIADGLSREKKQEDQNDEPARDDLELAPETESLFAAAETVQAHSFIQ